MSDVKRRVDRLEGQTNDGGGWHGLVFRHSDELYSLTENGKRMTWEQLTARYGIPSIVLPATVGLGT